MLDISLSRPLRSGGTQSGLLAGKEQSSQKDNADIVVANRVNNLCFSDLTVRVRFHPDHDAPKSADKRQRIAQ